MSNSTRRTFLKLAGATLATGLMGTAQADENPFGLKSLDTNPPSVAAMEGKCGEGKCGEGMDMSGSDSEKEKGKDGKKDGMEGKCGGAMPAS